MNLNKCIAFTTTSLARPDILEKTYDSFSKNIKQDLKEFTLFINVDPVPNNIRQKEIIEVANRYFNRVICNLPKEPNFTKAVSWCWKSAAAFPFIFQLEDDWVLEQEIDLNTLLYLFKNNPRLLQVVLRAYPYVYKKVVLSPSIIANKFFIAFSNNFDYTINPEVQLRNESILRIQQENLYVVGNTPIVSDIGRGWLKKEGLVKPIKSFFIKY